MPIFFDIDNTLLDDDYAVKQACLHLYEKFKERIHMNFKNFLISWHKSLQNNTLLYLKGTITFKEQRINRIRETLKFNKKEIDDENVTEIFDIYLKQYENNWKTFDDVENCLSSLNNEALGIISNGDKYQQSKKLKKTGIKKYFKSIIISSHTGFAKPDEKIFKIACKSLSAKPKDCLYIGDNLQTDVMACEKTGIHSIWLNRKNIKINWKKEHTIQSLKELPDLIYRQHASANRA